MSHLEQRQPGAGNAGPVVHPAWTQGRALPWATGSRAGKGSRRPRWSWRWTWTGAGRGGRRRAGRSQGDLPRSGPTCVPRAASAGVTRSVCPPCSAKRVADAGRRLVPTGLACHVPTGLLQQSGEGLPQTGICPLHLLRGGTFSLLGTAGWHELCPVCHGSHLAGSGRGFPCA